MEDQARGTSPEEILALRQEHSAPIMDQLRLWLDGEAARNVLPKSRLGEAVRYLKNQWEPLNDAHSRPRTCMDCGMMVRSEARKIAFRYSKHN